MGCFCEETIENFNDKHSILTEPKRWGQGAIDGLE